MNGEAGFPLFHVCSRPAGQVRRQVGRLSQRVTSMLCCRHQQYVEQSAIVARTHAMDSPILAHCAVCEHDFVHPQTCCAQACSLTYFLVIPQFPSPTFVEQAVVSDKPCADETMVELLMTCVRVGFKVHGIRMLIEQACCGGPLQVVLCRSW